MGKEVRGECSRKETTQIKINLVEKILLFVLKILKHRVIKKKEKIKLLTQKIEEYETNQIC